MSADDGAINEQMFEVWVSGAKLMKLLKDASISPERKAFINGIPLAVLFWKQSPLCTGARNPEEGRKEEARLPLSADVNLAARAKERQNLLPLLIGESYC